MTRTSASILKILSAYGLITAAMILSNIGVIAQEAKAPDLAALRKQFDEAVRTGDRARALDLATQMIAATEPEHVEALYAVAQLHARMGHREQAYIYLNRAIRGGIRGSRPAARG
jgi:tetratricopeptide (TPR) repeat protein